MSEWWDAIAGGLTDELAVDPASLELGVRGVFRLILAAALGAVFGWERELHHKAAGLRTHMLVAMGSAVAVVAGFEAGMNSGDLSRIVQGLVAGIGFLGGGVILKHTETNDIRNITTAAGIWMTAAIGIMAGLGRTWTAVIATLLGFAVLYVMRRLEQRFRPPPKHRGEPHDSSD